MTRSPRRIPSGHDRAVVLVMVLGILATMTIVATAFVMFMNQSYKAAANTQYIAQAELACRSGLEHAIRVIRYSKKKLVDGDWKMIMPDGVLMPDGSPVDFVDKEDLTNSEPDAGWHRYFEWDPGDPGESMQLSDPTKWVSHYHTDQNTDGVNDEKYGAERFGAASPTEHLMRGRLIDISYPTTPPIKRGQYAVCVVDLDGKLHADLTKWPEGQQSGNVSDLVKTIADEVCGLSTTEVSSLMFLSGLDLKGYSSLGEIARRADIRFGSPAGTAPMGKYTLEKHFTVYPLVRSDYAESSTLVATDTVITLRLGGLDPGFYVGGYVAFPSPGGGRYKVMENDVSTVKVEGDCTGESESKITVVTARPTVNVNTAPEALLNELLKCAPGLDAGADPQGPVKATALAKYLCARRPFAERHEFEEAVRRVTGDDAVDDLPGITPDANDPYVNHLSENQFNDVLNNAAGAFGDDGSAFDEDDSAYDDPINPGYYEFDGWKDATESLWEGPSQTGGIMSGGLKGTWSTELKFTSRFFHIYVLGRGWNVDADRAVGVRRLHAIYDAETQRILWLRWNLSSRGCVSDIN